MRPRSSPASSSRRSRSHALGERGVRHLGVHRLDHDLPVRARSRRRPVDHPLRGRSSWPAVTRGHERDRLERPGALRTDRRSPPLPIGVALAWLVPELITTPDDLVWPARIATLLLVLSIAARFPLGLFNNLLVAQQRFDVLEPRQLRRDRSLRRGRGRVPAPRRRADPARSADARRDAAASRATARLAPPRAAGPAASSRSRHARTAS